MRPRYPSAPPGRGYEHCGTARIDTHSALGSRQGWRSRLVHELRPRALLESLNAAVILYLLTAILTLSIAALVYSGPLAAQLPHALGGVLIGAALLVAIVSLFGSCGGAIAPAEDASGVIVALSAAAAAAALAGASPNVQFATVNVLVVGIDAGDGLVYLLVRAFGSARWCASCRTR